jgi:hypothetical protein
LVRAETVKGRAEVAVGKAEIVEGKAVDVEDQAVVAGKVGMSTLTPVILLQNPVTVFPLTAFLCQ